MKRVEAWHCVVWGFFLTAFVGAGALPFDTLHRQGRVTDQGPTNSTDRMFQTDLGLQNGTARIAEALRDLPAGSRVAVVYRVGTFQTLGGQLICHIAWSHGLRPFEVETETPNAKDQVFNGGAVAAFSLESEPPTWFPAPQVLGKHLSFTRLPAQ